MRRLPPPILTQCNAQYVICCRIAIGNEIGLALVDIDLESKKQGDVISTVTIMDSRNDTDRNRKAVSSL